MSPERTSRIFCFLPRFGVDVFEYMGVLAGMLFPSILCQMCDDVCCTNGEETSPQSDISSFIYFGWFVTFISLLNSLTAAGSDALCVWNSSEAPGMYHHNCRSEEQTEKKDLHPVKLKSGVAEKLKCLVCNFNDEESNSVFLPPREENKMFFFL